MFAKIATVPLLLALVTFAGFQEIEAVMCTYQLSETAIYSCSLVNQTILTESDMETVTGTHMTGFSNDDVTTLTAIGDSVVAIFPSPLINHFVNLRNAVLIGVDMKEFTNSIGNCRALSVVTLMINEISSIPRNIFQNCDQLTDLYLSLNRISSIDTLAFAGLTQLRFLSLSNNQINYLDPLIFQSTRRLEVLNLDSNSIREVSAQTFELLPSLTNLTLNSNSISAWSSTFHGNNQALQELRLDRNEISSLSGDVFINLPQLRVLRVGDLIEELPEFVGLNSLEEFWLNDNKLKTVSADSFRNLVNLRRLDLSFNNIETVNFTASLPNLDILSLTFNNIAEIPNGTFTMLSNLSDLSLRRNRIELLTAESIRPITQIRRLDVSHNRITRIEKNFFSGVTNMTFVSLGNVCVDNEITIESSNDFENRVIALLEPCFNFGTPSSVSTNILLLAGTFVFAYIRNI